MLNPNTTNVTQVMTKAQGQRRVKDVLELYTVKPSKGRMDKLKRVATLLKMYGYLQASIIPALERGFGLSQDEADVLKAFILNDFRDS